MLPDTIGDHTDVIACTSGRLAQPTRNTGNEPNEVYYGYEDNLSNVCVSASGESVYTNETGSDTEVETNTLWQEKSLRGSANEKFAIR